MHASAEKLDPSMAASAPLVCQNCKARKKACDKKLPSCSSCARRNVVCVYEAPEDEANTVEMRRRGIPATIFHTLDPSLRTSILLMDSASDSFPSGMVDFSEVEFNHAVHTQVSRIIRTTGLQVDDIVDQFFAGVATWCPVTSRQRFSDQLRHFSAFPTATFAVLLLTMCLVVYRPGPPNADSKVDQESLYLSTKMLFAHTNAVIPTSTNLMQASLLLTAFEYVQRRTYSALMSITLSARMGLAHGYHRYSSFNFMTDTEARVKAEERKILWWIVIVFERLIFLELPVKDQPMLSSLPTRDTLLPIEPDWLDELSRSGTTDHKPVPLFPIVDNDICAFGRACQGVYIYGSLLQALETKSLDDRRRALLSLDSEARVYLHAVLQQQPCVPIAMAIRGLLELHFNVIDISGHDAQIMQSSSATLESLTHMLVEIATVYVANYREDGVDRKPPTDVYVLQIVIDFVKSGRSGRANPSDDVQKLSAMLELFDRRWTLV